MRPYGRCGKCRKRFRITDDIARCQTCSLISDRLQARFLVFSEMESELDDYLEKWYGDTSGADPRSGSPSPSV
jgi:hypothetical protein